MITPNKQQQLVIDEALYHIHHSSEQTYQFSGLAGTGKSFVLNEIVKRSKLRLDEIAPMAYIGQAAVVMRLKGLVNARTIHSWMYEPVEKEILDKNDIPIYDDYFGTPVKGLGFNPVDNLKGIKLILVDEAGSVPLNVRKDIDNLGIKVIACGDIGQLPPVYGDPGYLYTGKVTYLTEVMRQKAGNAILYIADRARKGLPIQPGFYGNVLVIERKQLTNDMIASSDMIVCGKNRTRDNITKRIRHDILHIDTDLPMMHEKLMCRKNNWNISVNGISLTNGLIGSVANAPGPSDFDGKTFTIDFKPDLFNGMYSRLECNYNYLVSDFETRKKIKCDRFQQGEFLEFGYCGTTHTMQGSQYANGIYIEEFLDPNIQKNLNYTGVTRFTNSLIYVIPDRKIYY